MRVFIRQNGTGLYLGRDLKWRNDEESALHFRQSIEVMEFCARHNIANCQIVLRFGDRRWDITIEGPTPSQINRKVPGDEADGGTRAV